ncbi:MAG: phage holin family protein [Phenylobacterium sp.]|uniref:phage holin family protein n=1 Tax=Phenylobacterium sp. TaxID=1871053 RepID=UPI001A478FB5|nr:phage holin family protein [Phenylobacterium sp.]MBL8771660.1 phage holin family protein [Phenylobacterium sp.]
MARFVLRAVFAALGLWVASRIVPGVVVTSTGSLIAAALLLGIVNALVRPIVVILTLPLTLLTLGLFLLVVNAMMIGLVAVLLQGFQVHGLVPGVLAAIVTGFASWIGNAAIKDGRREG